MKTGIILEGGAMRGLFSVGILDVMMENDLYVDGAVGVSAGACFGYNYKSKQPGRAIRYNKRYCRDARYCSIRSMLRTGDMFGADFCYHEIPDKLDLFDTAAFIASPMEFYCVCTDMKSGKPIYYKMQKADAVDLDWLRGSASMPMAARIVRVDGYELLDGGVADSIPLKYFQSIGYKHNIVVLTQPRGFIKKKNSLLPFIRIKYRKYPEFIKAVEARHDMYNATTAYVSEQERMGDTLVLCPDRALPIGRVEHDPVKLQEVYELGREVAERRLDELQEFCGLKLSDKE